MILLTGSTYYKNHFYNKIFTLSNVQNLNKIIQFFVLLQNNIKYNSFIFKTIWYWIVNLFFEFYNSIITTLIID